jgi:hypothetical protein
MFFLIQKAGRIWYNMVVVNKFIKQITITIVADERSSVFVAGRAVEL